MEKNDKNVDNCLLQMLFDKLWNQVDNRLEPVVFYMLSFMSLDPDLEQVFIEAEQKMAVSFFLKISGQ